MRKVRSHHKKLRKWAEHSPENNQYKHLLLEAEWNRVKNRGDKAGGLYERAIEQARQNAFTQDEALAYELAARFYSETHNTEKAKDCLKKAQDKYSDWGASAKVEALHANGPRR